MRKSIIGTILMLSGLAWQHSAAEPASDKLQTFRLVGAFWRTDHSFAPQITLKNVVETAAVSVTPVLYAEDGTPYAMPAVTLEPSAATSIDIRSAIDAIPANVRSHFTDFGSAEIEYQWHWNAAIMAQISNLDAPRSLSYISNFHLPVSSSDTERKGSHVLKGLWWMYDGDVQPLISITNTSGQPLVPRLSIAAGTDANPGQPQSFRIAPGSTIRLNLRTWLPDSLRSGVAGMVRLEYEGPENALASDGELEDAQIGFSAVLPIRDVDASQELDPESPHLVTLGATGLMIGHPDPMMGFPASTVFSIYAVAANAGNETIQVTPKVYGGMQGANSPVTLPAIELQPGEAKRIPLFEAKAGGTTGMSGMPNLSLSYTGKESALLPVAGSIDQTGTYVLETPFSLEQETPSRTLCYWTLAGGTDTMYNVWNYMGSQQEVTLRLYYPGGVYEVPLSLAPGAAQMVDLKELLMEGKPDAKGHMLPMDVEEGSAKLEAPGGDNGRMKLIAAGATYNVETATCVFRCINCNGVSTLVIVPSPISLPVPVTSDVSIQATWNTGQTYNESSSNWSSANTGVAKVASGAVTAV